jgi:hypothetical protein
VTIRIPISGIKHRSEIVPITKAIREVLTEALKNCPSADEAPDMAYVRSVPPMRAYLLHRHKDAFNKDVTRFPLYMRGLTFRQIAYLEDQEAKGKPIAPEDLPREIGEEMPTERSVAESIKLTYEAIYLRPLPEKHPWQGEAGSVSAEGTGELAGEVPLGDDEFIGVGTDGRLPPQILRKDESGAWRQTVLPGSSESFTAEDEALPDLRSELAEGMNSLRNSEAAILAYLYGLRGEKWKMNHEAIGRYFGLTPERVREIEARAIAKLRERLQGSRATPRTDT